VQTAAFAFPGNVSSMNLSWLSACLRAVEFGLGLAALWAKKTLSPEWV
jgi:hypothetical protein